MILVVKMVVSVHARPLEHRLLRALLDAVNAQHCDILLYSGVLWLSRGKVYTRLEHLIPEMKSSLQERRDSYENSIIHSAS